MIVGTNKYRFIAEALDYNKGDIISQENLMQEHNAYGSDLSHLLSRVYTLDDGTEVCFGDLVWRERNYVVKQVQFSDVHVKQQSKLFSTAKACEEWLENNAENIKTELLKQNRNSSFQTLKAWVTKLDEHLSDLETVSMKNIIIIKNGLKQSIENIENV